MILTSDEINNALQGLSGWQIVDGYLSKEFTFKGFIQAFGFMTQVAIHAQVMKHHPEWSNVYNKVKINLITHDEGGITELDTRLAEKAERIYADMGL
ncbi:MAG: 4a-hydroxytetrahydrobiopterin dehydratase [Gammaproteobacteria bacterium]|jgi:4a-hydroxytetrahydrobiopterin dehydratase